jgi:hypothetical protein
MKSQCTDGRTSSVSTEQKRDGQTEQTNTQKTLGNYIRELKFPSDLIKRDRWHNLMEISMYGRTDSVRPYRTKKMRLTNTDKQTRRKPLGVLHLKELKFPSDLETCQEFESGDRWHNLMEIDTDGRTSSVEQNQNGQAQTGKHTKTSEEEVST